MSNRELKRWTRPAKADCSVPRYKVGRTVGATEELATLNSDERERLNWGASLLNIHHIWAVTQGEGVKVAVLDTGIDTDHPDLAGAVIGAEDFTGDGIEDVLGHGTHCAGIVGARLNGFGFVGVAPKAELLIGKVLGNGGTGSHESIANGIYWAVESKAQIISMSLGGEGSSNELFKAIQYALFHGVHIICAAGNEGALGSNTIGYPGRFGGVITVGSHDHNGNPSGFTSRGGEIDIMAPGSDIWSTYLDGGYASLSGTSMATPFVAGLAALLVSKHMHTSDNGTPLENVEDLKEHLLRMATHPGYHDNQSGYGPLLPFRYFSK
jgi:subtilisin family serine protease